jgi:hypothetical protein
MALGILRNHGRPSIKRLAGKKEPKNVLIKDSRPTTGWKHSHRFKYIDPVARTGDQAFKNQKATIGADKKADR